MTYLPPRADDGTPLTYAEDHCALCWPLVLLGTTLPASLVIIFIAGAITHTTSMPYIVGLILTDISYTVADPRIRLS